MDAITPEESIISTGSSANSSLEILENEVIRNYPKRQVRKFIAEDTIPQYGLLHNSSKNLKAGNIICAYNFLKDQKKVLWVRPKIKDMNYVQMFIDAFHAAYHERISKDKYQKLCKFYPNEMIPVSKPEDSQYIVVMYAHWKLLMLYFEPRHMKSPQFGNLDDTIKSRI